MAFVMIFSLFFSQAAGAAGADVPKEEALLKAGTPVEGQFEEGENVKWYTVDPSAAEIKDFTHLRVKFQSELEMNITVYSSLE
ncbi:hypothetical protein R0K17_28450, partial [Planococcus sp. SIMBA_143]